MDKKRVLIAFSGGLDTSFSVPFLMEKGYEVITMTLNSGGFTPTEMAEIEAKALKLGSKKHIALDVQQEMFEQMIGYQIQANGLFEGSYPLMCSDRYLIAEKLAEYAKLENCTAVATGNTGQGNDQVRIDVTLGILAPELENIAPIRDWALKREEEKKYLIDHGFEVPAKHSNYTKNQNVLGVTISGSEIDQLQEPKAEAFELTKQTASEPTYVELDFEAGLPVAMNGKAMAGVEILKQLNRIAGSYGFGRSRYIGDCMVGIKGAIWFEAPGILTLIAAHRALEQLVLTWKQQDLKAIIDREWAELAYNGLFGSPLTEDLKAYLEQNQQRVSGHLKVKIEPNRVSVVEISSPYSLIDRSIADYAQTASWNGEEAKAFIKIYGMQTLIASRKGKTLPQSLSLVKGGK